MVTVTTIGTGLSMLERAAWSNSQGDSPAHVMFADIPQFLGRYWLTIVACTLASIAAASALPPQCHAAVYGPGPTPDQLEDSADTARSGGGPNDLVGHAAGRKPGRPDPFRADRAACRGRSRSGQQCRTSVRYARASSPGLWRQSSSERALSEEDESQPGNRDGVGRAQVYSGSVYPMCWLSPTRRASRNWPRGSPTPLPTHTSRISLQRAPMPPGRGANGSKCVSTNCASR